MRIKLDENIAASAVVRLTALGHDVHIAAGSHADVLLIRLPDAEQWRISDYLVAWLSTPDTTTWERCFVVATPNKVRVRRPPVS